MNIYIESHCKGMIVQVSSFIKSCELCAYADDKVKSKEEDKVLKKIRKAANSFIKDLSEIVDK